MQEINCVHSFYLWAILDLNEFQLDFFDVSEEIHNQNEKVVCNAIVREVTELQPELRDSACLMKIDIEIIHSRMVQDLDGHGRRSTNKGLSYWGLANQNIEIIIPLPF